MIYVLLFIFLVGAIAIVTHIFNVKSNCKHHWQPQDDKLMCSKCGKMIPKKDPLYDKFSDAA